MYNQYSNTRYKHETLERLTNEQRITVDMSDSKRLSPIFWNMVAARLNWLYSPYFDADEMAIVIGADLVTKDGKVAKRISKWVYTKHNIRISDELVSDIGNWAYQSIANDSNTIVDIADTFDWNDGQFGKSGSCYWGEYAASRDTLEDAGAFCLRYWKDYDESLHRSNCGKGRTWVLPVNNDNAELVIFNAYGPSLQTSAVVICKLLGDGYTWHRISNLYNSNNYNIPYINSNSGIMVHKPDSNYADCMEFDIDLHCVEGKYYDESCSRYTCERCGTHLDEDDAHIDDDGYCYCQDCYDIYYFYCQHCDSECSVDDKVTIDYEDYCESCAEKVGVKCWNCEEWVLSDSDEYQIDNEGDVFCTRCAERHLSYCEGCEDYYYHVSLTDVNGTILCDACKEDATIAEDDNNDGINHPRPVVTENQIPLPF
jgi:hypothetical protein